METTRQKKVSRLLQRELAEIFRIMSGELLPGKMITVTVVRVSADFSIARVYLSIFPSDDMESELSLLRDNVGRVRYGLGTRVSSQLKKIPELSLFADDSLDYINNIDNLLHD